MKLIGDGPEYFVFNGSVDALTKAHPLQARVGDTVRIFFGNAGPNDTSSLHVVGEIFTRDYELGSLTSPPLTDVQTAGVPPGAAAVLEFSASAPGQFTMMDHAMARMAKGLMAVFDVSRSAERGLDARWTRFVGFLGEGIRCRGDWHEPRRYCGWWGTGRYGCSERWQLFLWPNKRDGRGNSEFDARHGNGHNQCKKATRAWFTTHARCIELEVLTS